MPLELADGMLAHARAVQRRLRDLPSRTGLYFVLALGLFPQLATAAADATRMCDVTPRRRSAVWEAMPTRAEG